MKIIVAIIFNTLFFSGKTLNNHNDSRLPFKIWLDLILYPRLRFPFDIKHKSQQSVMGSSLNYFLYNCKR